MNNYTNMEYNIMSVDMDDFMNNNFFMSFGNMYVSLCVFYNFKY